MPSCALFKCSNHSRKNNKTNGVTFHKFPQEGFLRHKWVNILRKQRQEFDWIPTINSRVCSVHFKPDDIYTTSKGLKRIKKEAVPFVQKVVPCEDDSSPNNRLDASSNSRVGRSEHVNCDKESETGMFRVRAVQAGRTFPETRSFTLDREVLMDLHELHDKIQNFYPTVQGKPFTVTFRGTDGDQCEYVFSSTSKLRSKGELHSGLRCDECGGSIVGFRYKCVTCDDYDLCGACEALGTHEQHLMIRIARPPNIKYPRALVKRWCEAMKTVGIPSFKKLTEVPEPATPATSAKSATHTTPHTAAVTEPKYYSEREEANYKIVYHEPKTVKIEYSVIDEDVVLQTPKLKLLKKVIKKKPAKKSATVVVDAIKKTEIKQERESASRFLGSFDTEETEPVVVMDTVKVKEEDPLDADLTLEQQTSEFLLAQQNVVHFRADSETGDGDQQLLQGRQTFRTVVAYGGANMEQGGAMVAPGQSMIAAVGGQVIVTPSTKNCDR